MKQILEDTFYTDSLFDAPILDPYKYKGKGRPKKTDYSPMTEVMSKSYLELNKQFLLKTRAIINTKNVKLNKKGSWVKKT